LSSRLHAGGLGKRDQVIHGPLVKGMGPVFHRSNLSGRRDQKVTRKAQRASPKRPQAKMAMGNPARPSAQGLEAAQEPKRRFHAILLVKVLLRISNQQEWNILLVRSDRLSGGVKDLFTEKK